VAGRPAPGERRRAAIDAAVDTAFGAADAAARVRSIVVVNGGRIVYERYHPLDGPDTVFPSFSVAKSFT
jgi:CubicO group peptidase (beta-lactamase class C family)